MNRVVVCPYCNRPSPEPAQLGLSYACSCGAVFAAVSDDDLDQGLKRLVSGLFQERSLSLVELMDSCQVTVFRSSLFDETQSPDQGLAEFVRQASFQGAAKTEAEVNLVWVARLDVPSPGDFVGKE